VYWLVAGDQPGLRIDNFNDLPTGTSYPQQFTQTVELRQRTTYFAALLNSSDDNFFGAIVSTHADRSNRCDADLSAATNSTPRMELVFKGVGEGVPHRRNSGLERTRPGPHRVLGSEQGKTARRSAQYLLRETNTVTLTAQDGDTDISLVDRITITYRIALRPMKSTQVLRAARAPRFRSRSFRKLRSECSTSRLPHDPSNWLLA